jgi:hypothetical protein
MSFVAETANELNRIIDGLVDIARGDAIAKAFDLHKRHGLATREALSRMLAKHSRALVDKSLPPTSLLRMATAEFLGAQIISLPERAPLEPTITIAPAEANRTATVDLLPLQVVFTHDDRGPLVDVRQLDTLTGEPAALAHALKVWFDEDRTNGEPRGLHRHVASSQFDHRSGPAVKMTVLRLRKQLAEAYERVELRPPEAHLLVQSKRIGYRLDPTIHVVREDLE